MRPVICMITGTAARAGDTPDGIAARVTAAARAGVALVQVRERTLEAREMTRLVARCVEAVQGTRTRVLVNDRLDVALAAGAHGVHLRGDSMPAPRARGLAPAGFLIGRSVHSIEEAQQAERTGGLDYLLFGTVFPTASKPGQATSGLAGLRAAAASVRLPVLAIGGVTPATLPGAGAAGAAGFAAIRLFADAPIERMKELVQQASLAFDTPRPRT